MASVRTNFAPAVCCVCTFLFTYAAFTAIPHWGLECYT